MSHLFICFQGGPFDSAWQSRYAKLYPNRLELHAENNKIQLIFMEDIEDIGTELVTVSKNVHYFYSRFYCHAFPFIIVYFHWHLSSKANIFYLSHIRCDFHRSLLDETVLTVFVLSSLTFVHLSSPHQADKLPGASDALHRHRQTQNITHNNISQKMEHYYHINSRI